MTRELRSDMTTSHIPIVLLTAKTSIESKLEGLEYGADDYITKPFSSGYLRARISSLLKQRGVLHDYFMKQALGSSEQENLAVPGASLDSISPSMPQSKIKGIAAYPRSESALLARFADTKFI